MEIDRFIPQLVEKPFLTQQNWKRFQHKVQSPKNFTS